MNFKKLRKYQAKHHKTLLSALIDALDVLYNAPTGAGKSTVVTSVIRELSQGDWNGAVVTVPMHTIRASFTENGAGAEGLFDETIYTDEKSTKRHFEKWVRKPWWDRSFATVLCRQSFEQCSLPRDLTGWVLFVDEAHGSTVESGDDAPLMGQRRAEWVRRGGRVVVVSATPYRNDGLKVYDDTFVQVRRSIAEHSLPDQDGKRYAPRHFEIHAVSLTGYHVRTHREHYGEELPEARKISRHAIKKMVEKWRADGCPKVIVIVPPGKADSWSHEVVKMFRKEMVSWNGQKARVFNAVGQDKFVQVKLNELLNRERGVGHIDNSEIDVIVACARFNEGTDWPLCSHVYQVGFPKTIGRTNQRWGRSFRDKTGIKKHPHPQVAQICFFVPEISGELKRKLKYDKLHLRMAMLMSAHLEDHKAGQFLVNVIRDLVKINTPEVAVRVDLEEIEAKLQPTDEEMQDVNLAFQLLRPDEEGLSLEEINRVADRFELDDRQRMLLRLRVAKDAEDPKVRQEMLRELHKAYRRMFKKPKGNGGKKGGELSEPTNLLPGLFNDLFDEYVVRKHKGLVRFNPPMTERNGRMISSFTGRTPRDIEKSMRKVMDLLHDFGRIRKGIEKYVKKHGDAPTDKSGDAEPYVGYPCTWLEINRWCRANESFVKKSLGVA